MLRTLSRYFARSAGATTRTRSVVGDRRRALRPRAQALDEARRVSLSGRRRRVRGDAAVPPRAMTSGGHERLVPTSGCSPSRRRTATTSSAASAISASSSPTCCPRRSRSSTARAAWEELGAHGGRRAAAPSSSARRHRWWCSAAGWAATSRPPLTQGLHRGGLARRQAATKPAETLPLDEVLRHAPRRRTRRCCCCSTSSRNSSSIIPSRRDPESFEAQFARAVNRDDVDIGVLVALREDSLSRLDRFQERIPNLLSNRLRLAHLDEAGATNAIRRPLEVWNARHEGQPSVRADDDLVGAAHRRGPDRTCRRRTGGGSGVAAVKGSSDRGALPPARPDAALGRGDGVRDRGRCAWPPCRSCIGCAEEIVRRLLERVMQDAGPHSARPCAPASLIASSPRRETRWRAARRAWHAGQVHSHPTCSRVLEITVCSQCAFCAPVAVAGRRLDATSYRDLSRRARAGGAQLAASLGGGCRSARRPSTRRVSKRRSGRCANGSSRSSLMTGVVHCRLGQASLETLRAEANLQGRRVHRQRRPIDAWLGARSRVGRGRHHHPSGACRDIVRPRTPCARPSRHHVWGGACRSASCVSERVLCALTASRWPCAGKGLAWRRVGHRVRSTRVQEAARTFPHGDEWVRQDLFLPGFNRIVTVRPVSGAVWICRSVEVRPQVEFLQAQPRSSPRWRRVRDGSASRDGHERAARGRGYLTWCGSLTRGARSRSRRSTWLAPGSWGWPSVPTGAASRRRWWSAARRPGRSPRCGASRLGRAS